jgi:glycosyltransferase involved in cell wall biosynthesis
MVTEPVKIIRDLIAPSLLVGEGWGEGDSECLTLSLALSHQGRGDWSRGNSQPKFPAEQPRSKNTPTKISVIIITKNEAMNIRPCLESVAWADEIIVVDSGSTDDTVAICKELGAQVYVHDWLGFGPQKNRALSYAKNEWVLSIDADERVTPELKMQLITAIQAEHTDGFYVPRLSQFCGKFIRHCGWYPDYILRLFKKSQGQFSDDVVHERVVVKGLTERLTSSLLHYTYLTEEDVQRKTKQYAQAGAEKLFSKGKNASLIDAPIRASWAFIRTYSLRLGFLDGIAGFKIAQMNAKTTYLKYQQLRAMRLTETTL